MIYLALARYSESNKHDCWYTLEQSTMQEAANVVWNEYRQHFNDIEEPEMWEVVVAEIAYSALPLALGNFETGWIDVPHKTFLGNDLESSSF